jgi:hypothetical protein
MTQPPRPQYTAPVHQQDRSERRFSLLNKFLGTLSALLALVTAALGLWTVQATQSERSAQAQATSNGAAASALQGKNNELQDQNSQLRSQLNGPTASVLPGTPASVRHQGTISLSADGNTVDLDSPTTDPQWETDPWDVRYASNGAGLLVFNTPAYKVSSPADYDLCRSTTGYKQGNYDASEVPAGQNLCVKTSDSRYSAIKVIRIDKTELVIDVVTYDPPFTNG